LERKVSEKIISGLDLGSSSVKYLIAEETDGNASIIGVGIVPSKSISKGVVVDLNKASEAIVQAKKQAEAMSGKKASAVYVTVSGAHIFSVNNRGVIVISKEGREIGNDDIKRVEESAKVLLLQPNQKIIHILPRQFIIDGQGGIRNPIGMSGIKLEEEVHIVTGSSTALYNIEKCISIAELEFGSFVLQSLSSSYSILGDQEKDLGIALLDVGAGTGDLIVYSNGNIAHTAVLPIGGEYITKDLAFALRISLEEAEKVKKKYGFVITSRGDIPSGDVEIEKMSSKEKLSVPYTEIGEIVTSRVDEILEGIRLELMKSGFWSSIPAGIVITGGCALLKGFAERASEILEIPSRVGFPKSDFALSDILSSPEYSASVGLISYAMENEKVVRRKSDLWKSLSWLKDIFE
jgi:cell division protein FtsA